MKVQQYKYEHVNNKFFLLIKLIRIECNSMNVNLEKYIHLFNYIFSTRLLQQMLEVSTNIRYDNNLLIND